MISSDCSLAVPRTRIDAGIEKLGVQAEVGCHKLIEKGGVQAEEPFARVQILKLETKAELTLIGSY